jgi:chemotaxis family two-component system response regulator PixG
VAAKYQFEAKKNSEQAAKMTTEKNSCMIAIQEFVASKQIRLFQGLKQNCFSGQLIFQDPQATEWIFFIYLGRIIYVTGGVHPVRRWRRQITTYMPKIAFRFQEELKSLDSHSSNWEICWEYHLLSCWVEQDKIMRDVAAQMIRSLVREVFFDITQVGEVIYQVKPQKKLLSQPLVMIDAEQQIIEAWKLWQTWQGANLGKYTPDLAPQIIQPQALQERTSPKTYQTLIRLLDGKHSLRDIATQRQTDVMLMLRSIMPYIHLGFLQLATIPDINSPTATLSSLEIDNPQLKDKNKYLIACIDNNYSLCQRIEKVVTTSGYQFIRQEDPLQAIAIMLDCKPNIIFIDSNLSQLSGYELCTQLRQLSCFQDTPIIILVENINLIDRVKAKMSGCSELVIEPLDNRLILNLIARYLSLLAPQV